MLSSVLFDVEKHRNILYFFLKTCDEILKEVQIEIERERMNKKI